jgi:hypothetical protein
VESVQGVILLITSCVSTRCEVIGALPHGISTCDHHGMPAPSGMSEMEECHHATSAATGFLSEQAFDLCGG